MSNQAFDAYDECVEKLEKAEAERDEARAERDKLREDIQAMDDSHHAEWMKLTAERDEARAERNHLAALLRDWLARDELGGSWPYLKQDSRAALNETQGGE